MDKLNFEKTGEGLLIVLEKSVYSRDMVERALKCFDLSHRVDEDSGFFRVLLRPGKEYCPESLGLEFNDALIASVRLKM